MQAQIQDQIEDEINRLVDIPGLDEQEEGYGISLFVAALVFILYCLLDRARKAKLISTPLWTVPRCALALSDRAGTMRT